MRPGGMLNDRACGDGELNINGHKYTGCFEEDGPEGNWVVWELVGKKQIQSKGRTITYDKGQRTDVFVPYKPAAKECKEAEQGREGRGDDEDDEEGEDE